MDTLWDRWLSFALLVMMIVFCLVALPACAFGRIEEAQDESTDTVTPMCTLDTVQHPFREAAPLPGGRGFLANGNHLGWDLMAPEGLPVYPLGCGVVRVARAANGYGTLAVVIEHRLRKPTLITNGRGMSVVVGSILSIYGHLRPTSEGSGRGVNTALRVGDIVYPETVIGYIEHRSRNGDGDEHLHFGLRLQSATAAQRSDPTAWFRGYDTAPSQRGWFADPRAFLRDMSVALEEDPPASMFDAGVSTDATVAPEDRIVRMDILSVSDRPSVPQFDAGIRDDRGIVSEDALPWVETDVTAIPERDVGTFLPVDAGVVTQDVPVLPSRIRYEFRVRSALRVAPPYRLRDHWWRMVTCGNTGSTAMEIVSGWARCDAEYLELFDGSFYLPDHPDWGDQGQIGTVANTPTRCTPVEGAEWRLTELATQRVVFQGPVSALPCRSVGTQDRLVFPE